MKSWIPSRAGHVRIPRSSRSGRRRCRRRRTSCRRRSPPKIRSSPSPPVRTSLPAPPKSRKVAVRLVASRRTPAISSDEQRAAVDVISLAGAEQVAVVHGDVVIELGAAAAAVALVAGRGDGRCSRGRRGSGIAGLGEVDRVVAAQDDSRRSRRRRRPCRRRPSGRASRRRRCRCRRRRSGRPCRGRRR